MYTAIVLTEESRSLLLKNFASFIPNGWEKKAHHFTVHMGDLSNSPAKDFPLNSLVDMTVVSFAKDDLVAAIGIESVVPSSNKIKHITLAVNRTKGGKPFFSNNLTEWASIEKTIYCKPFCVYGTLQEIE